MATSVFRDYFRGYEILGELGRGNARVLKARHTESGRLVAIKHFSFHSDEEMLRRFQQESAIMKSIQHPTIVKIVDVQLNAELPFIVMELIEGGDLRSLLRTHGTLAHNEVLRLAEHMTDALEVIHNNQIVHRDVKPENIMYRRNANGELQFLLTDFGIAKVREQRERITVTGASMLTYEYASPEQFNQSKTVSTPADYYSLGVVLYECITGSVPFDYHEDEPLPYIHRVLSSPVPIPFKPGLPAAIRQLLNGLLEKSSRNRISDPAVIRNLLKQAAAELTRGSRVDQIFKTRSYSDYIASENPTVAPVIRKSPWRAVGKTILILFTGLIIFWVLRAGQLILDSKNQAEKNRQIAERKTSLSQSQTNDQVLDSSGTADHERKSTPGKNEPKESGYYTSSAENSALYKPTSQTQEDAGIPMINDLYYNDFANRADSIWTSEDNTNEFRIENGKYIIEGNADTFTYHSSAKINIDAEKDFSISATATRLEGETPYGFGINFCGDTETDSYYVFYISSNGYYSVRSWEKDHWKIYVDWTKSSMIRTGREMNTLAIEKHSNNISFLINDQAETILPFEQPFGNYFGFRVDGRQKVAFDQLLIKGTP